MSDDQRTHFRTARLLYNFLKFNTVCTYTFMISAVFSLPSLIHMGKDMGFELAVVISKT